MIAIDVKECRTKHKRDDNKIEIVINEGLRLRFDSPNDLEELSSELIDQSYKIGGQQAP